MYCRAMNSRALGSCRAKALVIINHLDQFMSVQALDLRNMRLQAIGMKTLSERLGQGSGLRLRTLLCDGNDMGLEGMRSLATVMKDNKMAELQHLSLGNNDLGDEGLSVLADALVTGCCPNLTWLNLDGNMVKEGGAKALSQALAACPSVEHLTLRWTNLQDQGLRALADNGLQSGGKRLRELRLDGNAITWQGAEALAGSMRRHPWSKQLQHLSLRWNRVGDQGLASVAEAMQGMRCPKLKELDLIGNEIGGHGVQALAKALRAQGAPRLAKLSLAENRIGPVACKDLASAFRVGACPEMEDLWYVLAST